MPRVGPRDVLWRLRPPLPPGPPTWTPDATGLSIRWPDAYEWPLASTWVDALATDLARLVPVTRAPIPQVYEGIVHFEVDVGGRRHEVAIDYFDKHRLLDEVAERFPLVFKMQFLRDGYRCDNVVPGGYVASRPALYRFAPAARSLQRRRRRSDVFGRFSLAYATDLRREVVAKLREQDRFDYEGDVRLRGFAGYLADAARARVCVDLPGNGDLCHRLVEYLAVGCCVVRPEPETRLHVDLIEGEHIVYFRRDLSDLVDVCAALVADAPRRARIEAAARDYFDRYLHREQLARYYLDRLVATLVASRGSTESTGTCRAPTG